MLGNGSFSISFPKYLKIIILVPNSFSSKKRIFWYWQFFKSWKVEGIRSHTIPWVSFLFASCFNRIESGSVLVDWGRKK